MTLTSSNGNATKSKKNQAASSNKTAAALLQRITEDFKRLKLADASALTVAEDDDDLGSVDVVESPITCNSPSTSLFDSANFVDSDDDENLSSAYNQLSKSIINGNFAMVKQMLDHFDLNINHICDKNQNYSLLHMACLMGHSKIIKYLLDCGANVNLVTYDGQQPIDFIESDDLENLTYMLMKMNEAKKASSTATSTSTSTESLPTQP